MQRVLAVTFLVAPLLVACGTSTTPIFAGQGGDDAGPGDDVDLANRAQPAGDDGGAASIDPGGASEDMNCGGMQFAAQRVPPNVMFILDRSGSMMEPISLLNFGGPSKWAELKQGLQAVIPQYDPMVRFGGDLFSDPHNSGCNGGPVLVACGQMHGQSVLQAVNATKPGGQTPTAATFDEVIRTGMLNDPTRDNVIVLATDGQPNCGDTDVTSRISALYAQNPAVKTYVIGVGDETAANPQALNDWAVAGHTDRPGNTKYYQASNPGDLQTAFNTIVGGVVSCTFALAQKAPDAKQLYVWENGKMVPADAQNGFTYNDAGPSVTLHGAACDLLKSQPNTKVQVVYGCPAPPPVG